MVLVAFFALILAAGEPPIVLNKVPTKPKATGEVLDLQPRATNLILKFVMENSGKQEELSDVRLSNVSHYSHLVNVSTSASPPFIAPNGHWFARWTRDGEKRME